MKPGKKYRVISCDTRNTDHTIDETFTCTKARKDGYLATAKGVWSATPHTEAHDLYDFEEVIDYPRDAEAFMKRWPEIKSIVTFNDKSVTLYFSESYIGIRLAEHDFATAHVEMLRREAAKKPKQPYFRTPTGEDCDAIYLMTAAVNTITAAEVVAWKADAEKFRRTPETWQALIIKAAKYDAQC
jgi:hypothetical protein